MGAYKRIEMHSANTKLHRKPNCCIHGLEWFPAAKYYPAGSWVVEHCIYCIEHQDSAQCSHWTRRNAPFSLELLNELRRGRNSKPTFWWPLLQPYIEHCKFYFCSLWKYRQDASTGCAECLHVESRLVALLFPKSCYWIHGQFHIRYLCVKEMYCLTSRGHFQS